jgi:DNA-directed RNA polymerase I subunit RPA1
MSVKKITSAIAFDHMNNPMPGGLHDKALGVSPFDSLSSCETCGLQQTKCPGHCGHIQLAAPIYNSFLFKEVYKLLKSKCFECHRMRIHPEKIEAFTTALKMLKAGELVGAAKLK